MFCLNSFPLKARPIGSPVYSSSLPSRGCCPAIAVFLAPLSVPASLAPFHLLVVCPPASSSWPSSVPAPARLGLLQCPPPI